MRRQLILFFAAVVLLFLFFCMPFYNKWLVVNVIGRSGNIPAEYEHQSMRERLTMRFGHEYQTYKEIADYLRKLEAEPVLLLPPDEYVQASKVREFRVAEPITVYYLTAIRAVTINSPDVNHANWVLEPDGKGGIYIRRLKGREDIELLRIIYKKYQPRI